MNRTDTRKRAVGIILTMIMVGATGGDAQRARSFEVTEATIADIQRAIQSKRITTVGVVEQYLKRIKAYNGTCVNEPQGILGPVTTIPRAGQINALSTLNLRPAARERWGFDARSDALFHVAAGRAHGIRARHAAAPVARAAGRLLPLLGREMPAAARALPRTDASAPSAILFPSCVSRTMGALPGEPEGSSVPAALVNVAARAGVRLHIPEGIARRCCGMPFGSKG